MTAYPPLDIAGEWARLNEHLVALVDCIPDDKMNWSPKAELWNFRGILIHISGARHGWLTDTVRDGETAPNVLLEGQTRDGLTQHLRLSWERLQRFISDPAKLEATYQEEYDGVSNTLSGHWVAYHLLEHDIHHRADLFHYLALLGIEHPDVGTP